MQQPKGLPSRRRERARLTELDSNQLRYCLTTERVASSRFASGALNGELVEARILVPHRDLVHVDRDDLAARVGRGMPESLERLVAAPKCVAVLEERDAEHLGALPVDEHPEPERVLELRNVGVDPVADGRDHLVHTRLV